MGVEIIVSDILHCRRRGGNSDRQPGEDGGGMGGIVGQVAQETLLSAEGRSPLLLLGSWEQGNQVMTSACVPVDRWDVWKLRVDGLHTYMRPRLGQHVQHSRRAHELYWMH